MKLTFLICNQPILFCNQVLSIWKLLLLHFFHVRIWPEYDRYKKDEKYCETVCDGSPSACFVLCTMLSAVCFSLRSFLDWFVLSFVHSDEISLDSTWSSSSSCLARFLEIDISKPSRIVLLRLLYAALTFCLSDPCDSLLVPLPWSYSFRKTTVCLA